MSTAEHYVSSLDSLDWQVAQDFEANFRWEYADGRDQLLKLYRKGKRQQWDSDTRIDWSQDLDPENPAGLARRGHFHLRLADLAQARREGPHAAAPPPAGLAAVAVPAR